MNKNNASLKFLCLKISFLRSAFYLRTRHLLPCENWENVMKMRKFTILQDNATRFYISIIFASTICKV